MKGMEFRISSTNRVNGYEIIAVGKHETSLMVSAFLFLGESDRAQLNNNWRHSAIIRFRDSVMLFRLRILDYWYDRN